MIQFTMRLVETVQDGVYMLWDCAQAFPAAAGAIVAIIALAVIMLIAGR